MAGSTTLFKLVLNTHVSLYRLTGGRVGGRLGPMDVLLLTTTGRKSKQQRTIPLTYLKDGEDFVITASNGGGPNHPGWYFNLKENPKALIEVGGQKINVSSVQANPEQKKVYWARLVSIFPRYGTYQQHTSREIPMMVLHPEK